MEILGFSLEFVLLDASWCARVARPLYGVGRITKPSYTGKGGRLGLRKMSETCCSRTESGALEDIKSQFSFRDGAELGEARHDRKFKIIN